MWIMWKLKNVTKNHVWLRLILTTFWYFDLGSGKNWIPKNKANGLLAGLLIRLESCHDIGCGAVSASNLASNPAGKQVSCATDISRIWKSKEIL